MRKLAAWEKAIQDAFEAGRSARRHINRPTARPTYKDEARTLAYVCGFDYESILAKAKKLEGR